MAGNFKVETFQNEFLPAGTGEVHAIMTVTAGEGTVVSAGGGSGDRLIGILCDVSGSMEGGKILAAKQAMAKVVQLLPEDCRFFLVTGSDAAHLLVPAMRADAAGKQRALTAIQSVRAFGGTRISTWLLAALDQFLASAGGVRQALLLTDGQNDCLGPGGAAGGADAVRRGLPVRLPGGGDGLAGKPASGDCGAAARDGRHHRFAGAD